MRKANNSTESYFPSPWVYFNVPLEAVEELMALYVKVYLNGPNPTLSRVIQNAMHNEDLLQPQFNPQFRSLFGPKAMEAVKFAIIADHIGQKYQRFHPEFKMRPMPKEVMIYLRPPFCQMTDFSYDGQKRFRDSLPDKQKHEVILDE